MAISNIGELLKKAEEFEERIEKYYTAIRDKTEDNGVRLLTYYLGRHRRHLKQALHDFHSGEIDKICDELLMYGVEFDPEQKFHVMRKAPEEVKGNELLECATTYNEDLVSLYKNIIGQPISQEAKLLFEILISIEERDIVMLKKMIAMDYF